MLETRTIGSELKIYDVCDLVSGLENFLNYSWVQTQTGIASSLPDNVIVTLSPRAIRNKLPVCSIAGRDSNGNAVEGDRSYLCKLGLAQPLNAVGDPFESFPQGFVLKPVSSQRKDVFGTDIWCPHPRCKRHGCSSEKRVEIKIRCIRDFHTEHCYLVQSFLHPEYHNAYRCFEWWEAHASLCAKEYYLTAVKWLLNPSIRMRQYQRPTATGIIYRFNHRD